MTFRQVLDIVWRRRLLVAITTFLVLLASLLYGLLAPVAYEATTVLRYSPAGTATLSGSSSYGLINLDLDPEYLQSPELAEMAAKNLGDDPTSLQAAVQVDLLEGQRVSRLRVTAAGSSPQQARERANGISHAFINHLNDQVKNGVKTLQRDLARQQRIQSSSLARLSRVPSDQLAQSNFSSASSAIGEIQSQITTIRGNGDPASIQQLANNGSRKGVSFFTIMLIGFVSGLLAGAGAALIRDQFDDHVRSTEDVEEVIGDHVIGDIAVVSRRQLKLAPLPAANRLPTPLNESVRGLRTSLEVVFPQRHVAVVITSAEPGEGKTFVSANLAVAMARAGRSVILVEADLRRPRVRTYFELPETAPGFANLVEDGAGTEEIERTLIDTPHAGLRILPAGTSHSESADLLAGDTLEDVLGGLRSLADFVLLDSPPGLALADAAILGRAADGVLVISALNRTRGSALRDTLLSLNAYQVNVVGVAVNRSRRATVRSYAQYYHAAGTSQPAAEDDAGEGKSTTSDEPRRAVAAVETPHSESPADHPQAEDAAVPPRVTLDDSQSVVDEAPNQTKP